MGTPIMLSSRLSRRAITAYPSVVYKGLKTPEQAVANLTLSATTLKRFTTFNRTLGLQSVCREDAGIKSVFCNKKFLETNDVQELFQRYPSIIERRIHSSVENRIMRNGV